MTKDQLDKINGQTRALLKATEYELDERQLRQQERFRTHAHVTQQRKQLNGRRKSAIKISKWEMFRSVGLEEQSPLFQRIVAYVRCEHQMHVRRNMEQYRLDKELFEQG